MVYPHLIYGSTLWGATYKSSVNKLIVMQKKVIRAMLSAKYNAHTNDLFNELGILKSTIPDQTQNTEYNHKTDVVLLHLKVYYITAHKYGTLSRCIYT